MSPKILEAFRILSVAVSAAIILACGIVVNSSQAFAGFTNAGFESGTFIPWTVAYWRWPNSTLSTFPPTSIASLGFISATENGRVAVLSAGTDANTGNNLRYPLYGSKVVAVNIGGSSGRTADSIYQAATLTASDVDPADSKIHLRFAFAPVLQNPGHAPNQQPFYMVEVKNITKGTTLFFRYAYGGQSGVNWLTGINGNQYTNWQSIDISPGPGQLDVGDNVSLHVLASRCGASGHSGYIYVDAGDTGTSFPGLSVSAAATTTYARKSQDLTYTYTYINNTGASVSNVTVSATLPPNTTFVSQSGATCTNPSVGSAGTSTCSIGTLADGATGSFSITVFVASNATSPVSNGTYSMSGTGVITLSGSLVTTPIPDYTFTGPIGGRLNTASADFTITPNQAVTVVMSVTPVGGGLSTPVTRTFTASAAPQTFTITPTAVGPITLTPTNNASIVNTESLFYTTPPAPPTIGAATPGAGSASIAFTYTGSNGGSVISNYTATCTPTLGGSAVVGSSTTSPITISPLVPLTLYNCSVIATNSIGDSAASGSVSAMSGLLAQAADLTANATPSTLAFNATSALTITGGSGTGAVTYSVASGGSNCSISGTTLTGTGIGTCTVIATRAADTNYNLATSAAITITVGQATQTTLTAVATPGTIAYNGTSALTITGGSGTGAVTFAVTTGAANCTITGTTLTATGTGTCVVTGTKAADTNYSAQNSAALTITITPTSQSTLTLSTSNAMIVKGNSATLSATGGSGTGTITFQVATGAANCSITGATLTALAPGNCTITATKSADANFNSVISVPIAITTIAATLQLSLPSLSINATVGNLAIPARIVQVTATGPVTNISIVETTSSANFVFRVS